MLVVIKSTVPPGTTDAVRAKYGLRATFSPEYIGESKYYNPHFPSRMIEAPWFTVGGAPEDTARVVEILMTVGGPTKRYHQCTALVAEIAKYMENNFYANKICFCYEFSEICHAYGVDYNAVREAWLQDPRINNMHTAVFAGNDVPFSGKCLPKDLAAMISAAESVGYRADLLRAVATANTRIGSARRARRDLA
jgi:UDP-glucose 6-dehydrogenase